MEGIIYGMVMAFFLLVGIAVAAPLIGGIVGGVVASKRKKGVRKGFFVGLGYGSLLVVLGLRGCMSYEYLDTAWEERGARKQVEKEVKIWAKKNGLDDHRIILDAVDISSLWQNERREVPSRDYTGWVKMMNGWGQLKDGLFITIAVWKPNGEKCPATNVKKGNGVRVWYNDDGTEDGRWIYKDGKVVSVVPNPKPIPFLHIGCRTLLAIGLPHGDSYKQAVLQLPPAIHHLYPSRIIPRGYLSTLVLPK
jgi:hypothetical protein